MRSIFLTAFLCTMIFSSCTSSDDAQSEVVEDVDSRQVTISLSMGVSSGMSSHRQNAKQIVGTRASNNVPPPRQLTTVDAAQEVNDVRVYLFRYDTEDGDYKYYIPSNAAEGGYCQVSAFNNATPYSSSDNNGELEAHSFEFYPQLVSGYYRLLGIGRDDKTATSPTDAKAWGGKRLNDISLIKGVTKIDDVEAAISSSANVRDGTLWCTEIFSGRDDEEPINISANSGVYFKHTLTLQRAVAGVLLYVRNIPLTVESNEPGKTAKEFTPASLSLCLTTASNGVNLSTFKAAGTTSSNRIVAKIDLTGTDWTKNTEKNVFTRDSDTVSNLWSNSELVGNYIMPVDRGSMTGGPLGGNNITFYLDYAGASGEHRYEVVELETSGGYERSFAIEANHLYAIGLKGKNVNQPYDLKDVYTPKMVDITIEIEPGFEQRHNYTIE